MLQKIRDYAQGVVSLVIIGGLIITFALWGVNSYFIDSESGGQVAVVNDENITRYEYQIAYQNERARMEQMFGKQFDLDSFETQIKSSALDRVIDNAVIMQNALNLGFIASDEQVSQVIQGIEAFKEEGKFSKAAYERQLRTSGEPTANFESRIRRAVLADQLIKGVTATGFVTDRFVESSQKLMEQQRELAYFILNAESFKKDIKIDDARVEQYYNLNSEQYKTPELVNLEYVELSADSLKSSVSANEDEIKEYFDANKTRYQTAEERKARHILVEGNGDDSKKKAQDLYERAKKGEDFAELAKKNSQDPGSADQGGMLDFFGRGVMDKAFEASAFSLKKGEISEPVLSQFGYHIIKLEDMRGGQGKSFEQVKGEIEQTVKQQKAEKLYFEKADKLSNLSFETPDSLDPLVTELGLTIKVTGDFGRSGGLGVAKEQKVITAAFSDDVLKEGLNSAALEIGKNRTVVVRRKDHKPAQVRPLAEVKAAIVNALTLEDAREVTKKRGHDLIAKVQSGADLKKVASEGKHAFTDKAFFRRSDGKANNEVLTHAFSISRPKEGKPVFEGTSLNNGDFAVIALYAVKDGDLNNISADEKKRLKENMGAAAGVDEFTAMISSFKSQAEIKRFENNL